MVRVRRLPPAALPRVLAVVARNTRDTAIWRALDRSL